MPGLQALDTQKFKESVTRTFEQIFQAQTRQQTLLNICLSYSIVCREKLFRLSERAAHFQDTDEDSQKLRDDVFRNIIEMHLDYFNRTGSAI